MFKSIKFTVQLSSILLLYSAFNGLLASTAAGEHHSETVFFTTRMIWTLINFAIYLGIIGKFIIPKVTAHFRAEHLLIKNKQLVAQEAYRKAELALNKVRQDLQTLDQKIVDIEAGYQRDLESLRLRYGREQQQKLGQFKEDLTHSFNQEKKALWDRSYRKILENVVHQAKLEVEKNAEQAQAYSSKVMKQL
jgi:F0F1-type ATP synthase membrane subunit b/b'